jgi:hypothetical protein
MIYLPNFFFILFCPVQTFVVLSFTRNMSLEQDSLNEDKLK